MARDLRIGVLASRPPAGLSSGVDALISYWREQIGRVLTDRPDLVALPEACDLPDGVDLAAHLEEAESRDRGLLEWFRMLAKQHRAWLALPTIRRDEAGIWRNSIRLIDRSGEVAGTYDKTYPTISEIEVGIAPGDPPEVIETEFGYVACAICFDLNFEELSRCYASQHPDLIVFSSMYHGGLAQPMWAYRCRAHMITAVSELPSGVVSPLGEVLATTTNYTSSLTTTINVDCCLAHLDGNKEKLDALKQACGREVEIHDPGLLGSVLITSRSPGQSARQMARELDIELLDEYLNRSTQRRDAVLGTPCAHLQDTSQGMV